MGVISPLGMEMGPYERSPKELPFLFYHVRSQASDIFKPGNGTSLDTESVDTLTVDFQSTEL